jgi:F0F1-type ATP synthase assembly protein I
LDESDDDRSPWALAMEWASLVTTIGMEMVLPTLGGFALDRWLGTLPIFLLIGAVLGFALGLLHLLKLASPRGGMKK